MLARWRRRRTVDDAQAFADYVRALTRVAAPAVPRPRTAGGAAAAAWHGRQAADLFFALQERLAGPAARHVHEVTGQIGQPVQLVGGRG